MFASISFVQFGLGYHPQILVFAGVFFFVCHQSLNTGVCILLFIFVSACVMSGCAIGTGAEPCFSAAEKEAFAEKKKIREENKQKMAGRKLSLQWCRCKQCVIMPSEAECYCCRDSLNMVGLCENVYQCITQHPDFNNIVVNRPVLNMLRFEKVRNGDNRFRIRENDNTNKVWRYMAYSTFIKWLRAETALGDEMPSLRYVIPACVTTKIRRLYPSQDGLYVGSRVRFGMQINYPA